jgi:Tfp pilus assembly protein PilW
MKFTRVALTIGLVVVAAVGVAVAVKTVREKKLVVDETAGNIQSELDALDPISRAAVLAKVSSDTTKGFRPGS